MKHLLCTLIAWITISAFLFIGCNGTVEQLTLNEDETANVDEEVLEKGDGASEKKSHPFGQAADFNVFAIDSIRYSCSEFCGVTGAVNQVTLRHMGINTSWAQPVSGYGLHVGGDFTAYSIGNYSEHPDGCRITGQTPGGVIVGDEIEVSDTDIVPKHGKKLNFNAISQALIKASSDYAQLAVTLSPFFEEGEVTITANSGCQVVDIAGSSFTGEGGVITIRAPKEATVILNIRGSYVTLLAKDFRLQGGILPGNVLLNFVDATSISIANIAISGTVLAPKASIYFEDGHIDGNLYAYKLVGGNPDTDNCDLLPGGEVRRVAFTGAFPDTCQPISPKGSAKE